MTEKILLKGITWNHSRGLVPMVATAQRFNELHPHVDIIWEKRSLQQFADLSIEQLAERYDLLVIDHPWAGFAARTRAILPIDESLSAAFLLDQAKNTVGRSHESYSFHGHQWALAIDAATPVAASRPDLLAKENLALPKNFSDLLDLASRGRVAFAGIPIDVLMAFYGFCCSLGEPPCQQEEIVVSPATGKEALQMFRRLAQMVSPAFFQRNPIQVYEAMTSTDEIFYCPFAYGYSNYSRPGYAKHLLHFHDLICLDGKEPMTTTLGGTGLAVSGQGKNTDAAMQYAEFVASPQCQRTVYAFNGGQPGHLQAWADAETNRQTANYFTATLPALQRAFLRPRYHGSMHFQDHAGDPVRNYLLHGGDEEQLLQKLNELYQKSRTPA